MKKTYLLGLALCLLAVGNGAGMEKAKKTTTKLPDDCFTVICEFLPFKDLMGFRHTNKRFFLVVQNHFDRKDLGIIKIDQKITYNTKTRALDYQYSKISCGQLKGLLSIFGKNLKKLNLFRTNISDLKHLPPSLEDLCLWECNIKDSSHLKNFMNLKKLNLDHTNISDLKHLPKSLEELDLCGCKNINDFSHLKNFKNLKILYLYRTNILNETVEELQKNLPNLKIIKL